MIHRYATALIASAAISLCACGANDGTATTDADEVTASESSEALTSSNAAWCITHTFGLRYLRHPSWSSPDWHFDVYNYYGTYEGGAQAWSNGSCAHGIGVSAKAYGHLYGSRCCAP
jgi:hypothetical protein